MHEGLLNFWYAVEHAGAVAASPCRVTLMDTNYVLYRDSSGNPYAILDRCPHRGASFNQGWIENDCLRCPYHGWSFNHQGHCVKVPADLSGVAIPANARLTLVPVVEKAGFLWIFPGDSTRADKNLIPDFPELGANGWRQVSGEYEWNANFSRVVESGLDTSHAPFVHKNFFGNRDNAVVHPLQIEDDNGCVGCAINISPPRKRGVFKYFLKEKKARQPITRLSCFLPSVSRMEFDLDSKGFCFIYMASNIPVSATRTLTKWIEVRNFAKTALADGQFIRDTVNTYLEDKALIETQEPGLTWDLKQKEILLASDHLILAYRKRMAALLSISS